MNKSVSSCLDTAEIHRFWLRTFHARRYEMAIFTETVLMSLSGSVPQVGEFESAIQSVF